MAEEVRLWEVDADNQLRDVQPSQLEKEERIEEWIKRDISILDPALLVIGQQVRTDFGKFIDLLCMDSDGNLVIVELKRGMTPREVTAQALDYGSWVKDLDVDKIAAIAAEYFRKPGSKYPDLEKAFAEKFDSDLPEKINAHHAMRVVASEIDDSTERIIRYLSETYGVDINAACFQFFKTMDGRQLLARTFTVTKAEKKRPPEKRPHTETELLAMAKANGTEELVNICRQMRDVWEEEPIWTAEGSFRYWTGGRMVYGVNASGKLTGADPPQQGQLDAWLRTDKLAELTGVSEEAIKQRFSKTFTPFPAGRMDFVLRLKSRKEAELFIEELKALAQEQSKRSIAVA